MLPSNQLCRRPCTVQQLHCTTASMSLLLHPSAGLTACLPACVCAVSPQVSLPPSDTVLLRVTPADIAKLPAAIQAAADAAAAEQRPPGDASAAGSSSVMVRAARRSSTDGSSSTHPAAARSATPTAAAGALTPRAVAPSMLASGVGWRTAAAAADPAAASTMLGAAGGGHGVAAAGGGGGVDLAVENARLRAELAGLLAQQAAKELGEDLASTAAAGAAAAGASQLLGASVTTAAGAAASSMALAASTAAAATAGQQQQQRPYGHGGSPVVPASVTAALPSVSAALAGAQQVQEGAAAAAATQRALTLGPVKVRGGGLGLPILVRAELLQACTSSGYGGGFGFYHRKAPLQLNFKTGLCFASPEHTPIHCWPLHISWFGQCRDSHLMFGSPRVKV